MLFTFTPEGVAAVMLTAKLDEYGRGAWIALLILGFCVWWPIGLALLAFMMFSGRMRCGPNGPGRWHNAPSGGAGRGGCGWGGGFGGGWRQAPSGNRAFDEYRAETLKRLEEEQKEFVDYLERL